MFEILVMVCETFDLGYTLVSEDGIFERFVFHKR